MLKDYKFCPKPKQTRLRVKGSRAFVRLRAPSPQLSFSPQKKSRLDKIVLSTVFVFVATGFVFSNLAGFASQNTSFDSLGSALELPDLKLSNFPPYEPQLPFSSNDAPAVTEANSPPIQAPIANPKNSESTSWREHKVQRGENLAKIFSQQGLSPAVLHTITHNTADGHKLADIHPGQKFRFQITDEGQLAALEFAKDGISSIRISHVDGKYHSEALNKDLESRKTSLSGTIQSSLFNAGVKAGLSDSQVMELANIFAWDIDFALELRAGDSFSVVFEEQMLDGEKYDNGPILAAEFVNRGKIYRAVRYEDPDAGVDYFGPDGFTKKRAFLKTPVKFARISSGFSKRRWHPVLKKWRSHKGVDYAAPTGTPVRATGSGRVSIRGTQNGYGRVVYINHGDKYTTVYGHLSRFHPAVKRGSRVKQGQIIGYVGQSGLATGPHLHYEFRVGGKHRNPLTLKLPESIQLPKRRLADFRRYAAPLLAQLDNLSNKTMVAIADLNH